MAAAGFPEMSVFIYSSTWNHITKDSDICHHHCSASKAQYLQNKVNF
jgi:hypothetical protein